MDLLERESQLAELRASLTDAAAGRGGLVLVSGEAGAGKTALVQQLAAGGAVRHVLWGMCDDLLTPRPLGPIWDIAAQVGGRLADTARGGRSAEILDALRAEVDQPPHPSLLVVEDAQWADAATLDAIRFLGRRIRRLHAVLVVTFREDEVPVDHPLRLAIGAVPVQDVRRLRLPPLSRTAVTRLAGGADVAELYELTGGNPFYVREVLAQPGTPVPATVQDAVLSRTRRLPGPAHDCVEVVSVLPGRAEREVIEDCGCADGLDDAVRRGVLYANETMAWFGHELTRRAVELSMPAPRRRRLNEVVLRALAERNVEPARLVHHAIEAHDAAAIVRYAPAAARRAAALDSHREAVEHLEQALRHLPQPSADLLDEYASECQLAGQSAKALSAARRAIELHLTTGDRRRMGAGLCLLADTYWELGQGTEAEVASARAVATLSTQPLSRELARAYAQRARLAMFDYRGEEAIAWGTRAIDLSRRLGDNEVLANALITVGDVRWHVPPYDPRQLEEGLELALAHGLSAAAARGYSNLAEGHTAFSQYMQAQPYFEDGLAFCESRDLVVNVNYLLANRAQWHLEQGRWADAERDLERPLAGEDVSRVTAVRVLGLLRTRRGEPAAAATLNEAQRLADRSVAKQDTVPVACARAELAWLAGDLDAVRRVAAAALPVRSAGFARWVNELAFWALRAGATVPAGLVVQGPYALQLGGRCWEAAEQWAALSRPYEQADALAASDQAEYLLDALKIFDRLGAARRASMVRRRLAEMGVGSIPRGPRAATRDHPAGLTARQAEVLELLALNLTYQQIADRLHVSVKTVDHHATAVRTKLDVSTRADAVEAARRLGALDDGDGDGAARRRS